MEHDLGIVGADVHRQVSPGSSWFELVAREGGKVHERDGPTLRQAESI
jgi:hypothetical protein